MSFPQMAVAGSSVRPPRLCSVTCSAPWVTFLVRFSSRETSAAAAVPSGRGGPSCAARSCSVHTGAASWTSPRQRVRRLSSRRQRADCLREEPQSAVGPTPIQAAGAESPDVSASTFVPLAAAPSTAGLRSRPRSRAKPGRTRPGGIVGRRSRRDAVEGPGTRSREAPRCSRRMRWNAAAPAAGRLRAPRSGPGSLAAPGRSAPATGAVPEHPTRLPLHSPLQRAIAEP